MEVKIVRLVAVLMGALLLGSGSVAAGATSTTGSAEYWPLRFVLDRPLEVGGETRVRLRNVGDESYVYNAAYEACYMSFRVRGGRRFIIPEGTHCDTRDRQELAPGETVILFTWDLDECIEDSWGCIKAKDLPGGRYVMRGWFRPADGGDVVRAVRAFRIRRRS